MPRSVFSVLTRLFKAYAQRDKYTKWGAVMMLYHEDANYLESQLPADILDMYYEPCFLPEASFV